MPRVRLTGLILFITTIFLGLAAAATQTWTIAIKRPSWAKSATKISSEEDSQIAGNTESDDSQAVPPNSNASEPGSANKLQFVQVPVFRPLAFFGVLGLILWFVPAGLTAGLAPPKKRRRRKRR